MNYEERNEQSKGYKSFRISLDFGMGMLYIVIGIFILYIHYFGAIELPAVYAYVLGGAMVLYGAFRIYRGIAAMRQGKRNFR